MTEHYQQISFSIARLLCLAVYWAAEMIWCKSNFLDVSGAQFILEWFDFVGSYFFKPIPIVINPIIPPKKIMLVSFIYNIYIYIYYKIVKKYNK